MGQKIRAARKALKLTQLDLGVRAGISAEHVCRIEKGRATHLEPGTAHGLRVSLGISRDEWEGMA